MATRSSLWDRALSGLVVFLAEAAVTVGVIVLALAVAFVVELLL